MNLESLLHHLDAERRSLAQLGETIEVLPHVTRLRSADGSRHVIMFSLLSSDNADAVIAEQIAHYQGVSGEVEWKVYGHDQPADLRDRLAAQGFSIGDQEAVLVLGLSGPPAWIDEPPTCPLIRVERSEQVDLFRKAAEDIFKKDFAFTAGELLAALAAHSTQHVAYIALDGSMPVSIGRLYTHPQSMFGGLYTGGTLESHRGRGLYRAVVAARARDAMMRGARWLIVDALPTSRPILEKLGFVRLTETWACTMRATPCQGS